MERPRSSLARTARARALGRSARAVRLALPLTAVLGLLLAPMASAQNSQICGDKDWHGDTNEFGKMCMKFQETMLGEAIAVEARITLNHLYEDRDAAYFLIQFNTDMTPFTMSDITLTHDGNEIPLYKREGDKLFVDIADMPSAGETFVLGATANACERGLYQLGALIQPFNYRWQRIVMGDGQPADLYAFTQVGVNEASCSGGIPGLPKVSPAGGLVGAVAALALVAVAARKRR